MQAHDDAPAGRGRRVWSRTVRWGLGLAALASAALVFGAPADVARGLAWLQAQVQSSGALAIESRSADAVQARCETAATLLKLAGPSAQVTALVGTLQGSDQATETLGCWQQLRTQLGQTVLSSELDARRVAQQGWGAYEGFGASSAVDSGFALAAQLQTLGSTDKAAVLAWLGSAQAADGSFASAGRADLLATAVVVRGLQGEAARNVTAAAIASKAANWLLARRNSQGHWLNDAVVTAIVFEAVQPYTGGDPSVAAGVEAWLTGRQGADGSWAGDPYVTAVALRALALVGVTPVDPGTSATSATIRGVATLASGAQPAAGVSIQVQPSAGPLRTGVTDAQGRYQVSGITPGSMTVSATLAGYSSVTAVVSVAAGAAADFSPSLYASGSSIPSTAHVRGKVLAFTGNTPVAGATVQVTGAGNVSGTTDAQGAFDLTVPSGAYTVGYSATGYISQAQQVVLPAGANADLGTILLKALPTTSVVRGVVSDLQGAPIAGATVSIAGGASTTTNGAGAYALSGVSGLQFNLRAAAAGYISRDITLTVSAPGEVVQDLKLPGLTASYLALSNLTLSRATASLRQDITATATVSNPSSGASSAVANAQILDAQGKVLATVAALGSNGQGIPLLTLQPAGTQAVSFKWNTASFPPGDYRLVARLVQQDSITRDNPFGNVVDSQQRGFSITTGASFIGSITANPPVLRSGTNTPVKLSALVQNDGNTALPAQTFQLTAVDVKTSQVLMTRTASVSELPVQQLSPIAFDDWTPTTAGSMRLELTSIASSAKVTTTLYVGDSGSATFTVDRSQVPAGDQKVRANITVTGQSVTTGTINDPLAPLVKTAVTKAVNFGDDYMRRDYGANFKCFACHVQSQALVGGERNRRFAPPVDEGQRHMFLNTITQSVGRSGEINHEDWAIVVPTFLGLWGSGEAKDRNDVISSRRMLAEYMLKKQRADGAWDFDFDAAWWRHQSSMTGVTLEAMSRLKADVLAGNVPMQTTLVPFRPTGLPGGIMRVQSGPDGTLYVNQANGLYRVPPGGTATLIVPNRSDLTVRSGYPTLDGRVVIGADQGVFLRSADGTLTKISSLRTHDAQPYGIGRYLVSEFPVNAFAGTANYVKLLDDAGNMTPFISDAGLAYALPPAVMPDGDILVAGHISTNVMRFRSDGTLRDIPVPYTAWSRSDQPGRPFNVIRFGNGVVVSSEGGLTYYNENWVGERWAHDVVYGTVATPDGRLIVGFADGLYEVRRTPIDAAAFAQRLETSIGSAATWLRTTATAPASNSNIDMAFRLYGLARARDHFKGTSRANEFDAGILSLGALLRSRQRTNGGWVWMENSGMNTPDPMVTAQVSLALDALNPSASAPEVRKSIEYLLSVQQTDDTWRSVHPNPTWPKSGIASTPLIPSTWVEIWLPTLLDRLGGIDTDLKVRLPQNVELSAPDRAPTSTTPEADGGKTYVWKLTGVTEASQQVNFDATLKGMQVDETRAVAASANLVFNNSFVSGDSVTAAIEVPKVSVGTSLTQALATNKASYTDLDQAIFTSTIGNAGTSARDAQVRFTILDASGQVVDALPLTPLVSVPGPGSGTRQATWPVGGVLSGPYTVKAELLSATGTLYATSTASFTVTASVDQANSARINTDRVSYTAAQSVQLTSRVANLTSNTVQDNLQAVTTVTGAGGAGVYTRTEAIPQLAASTQRQFGYTVAASGLAPGSYTAAVKLLGATGSVLSQSTATFTVLGADQSGVGLSGLVQAPATVQIGQVANVTLTATNSGNAALANTPVVVRIVDPQTATVLASTTQTFASWAQGATQAMAYAWTAQGVDGQVVVATATATVNGREVSLGQANIQLVGVAILQVQPTTATFAPIYSGESAQQTITVSSAGSKAATGLTFALAGTDATQFVISGGTCLGVTTMAPGATCTLVVSYRPRAVGSHTAEVRVSSPVAQTVTLPLTGQARAVLFSGSVTAGSAQVEPGQNVTLNYTVSNPSTATAQMGGTLAVKQADGQTIASWPLSLNVAGTASYAGNQPYTAGNQAQTLTVVLSQQVGTATAVLGTTSFVVTDAQVPLAVAAAQQSGARILVLVSCPVGTSAKDDPACVAQRSTAIQSYLTSIGLSATVVSTAQDFTAQMRCGSYNTYWISNGALKLDASVIGELRQAIWRGEALWMDGVHDSRNQLLHDAAGVKQLGKLSQGNQTAIYDGAGLFGAGQLATLGQPTTFELTTGHAQALFTQVSGNQQPVPAVVSNAWGQGRSLLFAFDLAAAITADPAAAGVPLRTFVGASATHAASGSAPLTLGDLTTVHASVTNQGSSTVNLSVTMQLPAGFASVQAGNAQVTANSDGTTTAVWTFSLAKGATANVDWLVRAQAAGTSAVSIQVHSLPAAGTSGTPRLRDSQSVTLEVKDPASLVHEALVKTQSLDPPAASDRNNRQKALDAVTQALALHGQGQYEAAIASWLDAMAAVENVTSSDTKAARTAIAMALEATTDALCLQRCGQASCQ